MAKKPGGKAASRFLAGLGIGGEWVQDLVRKATLQGWNEDEFARALVRKPQFKRMFPGLVKGGELAVDFTTGVTGVTASGLVSAVGRYQQGYDDFQAVATTYGFKVTKRMFGTAVRREISPDEFGARLQVGKALRENPSLLDAFNEQLKFMGRKPLGDMDKRKFLVKAAAPDLYDAYEAAYLRSAGLDLTAEEAGRAAASVGQIGAPTANIQEIVNQIRSAKVDYGPELARAGITDEDLVTLGTGADPKNLATTVAQIYAQRRALGQSYQQTPLRRSSTGGIAIFEEDEAAAY